MPSYAETPVMAYDWMIVVYFFLGGLSAGAFLFSFVANHWKLDLRPMAKAPAIIAPVALGLGLAVLLLDLGQPFRSYYLFTHFNPRSALSWGVWFLNIFLVLSAIYAWQNFKGLVDKAKTVGIFAIPFAILTAGYTGVLLTQAPGKALWHSAMVPVLFVNGAIISGVAIALLASGSKVESSVRSGVAKCLAGLVILELLLIAVEIIVFLNVGGHDAAAARGLFKGKIGCLFTAVELLLGSVIPIGILLAFKKSAIAQSIAAVLVLIGIFTMRYVVVIGGQVIH